MLDTSFAPIPASDVCQAESTETKTDNTAAIIGGVVAVAVAVALIAAVTVIVIVILVLRSRSAYYSTSKTRLVCPAKRYIPLNKAWCIRVSMYKMVLHMVYFSNNCSFQRVSWCSGNYKSIRSSPSSQRQYMCKSPHMKHCELIFYTTDGLTPEIQTSS